MWGRPTGKATERVGAVASALDRWSQPPVARVNALRRKPSRNIIRGIAALERAHLVLIRRDDWDVPWWDVPWFCSYAETTSPVALGRDHLPPKPVSIEDAREHSIRSGRRQPDGGTEQSGGGDGFEVEQIQLCVLPRDLRHCGHREARIGKSDVLAQSEQAQDGSLLL